MLDYLCNKLGKKIGFYFGYVDDVKNGYRVIDNLESI